MATRSRKIATAEPPVTDPPAMHATHACWQNENSFWHEELKLWQDELASTRREIADVAAAIERHGKKLAEHGAALTLFGQEAGSDEHALVEFERGSAGQTVPGLARATTGGGRASCGDAPRSRAAQSTASYAGGPLLARAQGARGKLAGLRRGPVSRPIRQRNPTMKRMLLLAVVLLLPAVVLNIGQAEGARQGEAGPRRAELLDEEEAAILGRNSGRPGPGKTSSKSGPVPRR